MRAAILLLAVLSGVACIGTLWPVFGPGNRGTATESDSDSRESSRIAPVVPNPSTSTAGDKRVEQRTKIEQEVATIAKPENRAVQSPKTQEVVDDLQVPDKPPDDWTDEDRGNMRRRIPAIIAKEEGGLSGLMEAICSADASALSAPSCSVLAMIFGGAGISFGGGSNIHEQVAALRAMQTGNYDDLANLLAAELWPPSGATNELVDALVTHFNADRTKLGEALSNSSRAAICVRLNDATTQQKAQLRKFLTEQLDGSEELVDSFVGGSGCN